MSPLPPDRRPSDVAEAAALFDVALSNSAELPGDIIDRYTLIRPIGEGGFGRVWLASQSEPLRREVAIKILKPGMDSEEIISRFREEWKSLALMTHPGIARVFDAGITSSGRPYFTMEYVDGQPITAYCDHHALSMEERLRLFIKVCLAVQHAHQRGLIHRDLKPSNILVCQEDGSHAPRVIDFGTARALGQAAADRSYVTRFQQIIGTPGYMSPEQAKQESVDDLDTRTDIYSLGAVLYEMLTGSLPIQSDEIGNQAWDATLHHLRETIPLQPSRRITTLDLEQRTHIARQRGLPSDRLRHALLGDLDWITLKCLEKERQRRYDSVGALAEDIRLHLENLPVSARPPDRAYLIGRAIRRNRLAFGLGSLALAALVATACISTLFFLRERDARIQAENLRRETQAAREAAGRARSSAEDLMDWALDDLRNKLAPLGRLELLDSLGSATESYYQNLPASEKKRGSEIRRSRILLLRGDVLYQRNELPKAIGLYQEGIALLEPILSEDPNLEAKRWHSTLLSRSGDALFGHGRFGEAVAMRQRHTQAMREFVAARPDDGHFLGQLCISLRKLAESLDRVGQPEAFQSTLEECLTLSRRHAPGHVKMVLQVLATWQKRVGDYPAAIASFREAVADFDRMAEASPERVKELRNGVQGRISMADCLLEIGKAEEALAVITRAREDAERFNRIDPTNRDVHGDLGCVFMVSGELHFKSGNEAAALADFRESLRIFTELSRRDPKLIFWQQNFSRFIRETEPLVSGAAPSPASMLLVAEIHLANAECRHAAGKPHEARSQLQACRKWLEKIAPNEADSLVQRAKTLETKLLGEGK
jgi:eukaryotic-like serine/threonine-protein kinase